MRNKSEDTMRVQIIACSEPQYWYKGLIGSIIEVVPDKMLSGLYIPLTELHKEYAEQDGIRECDCKVITSSSQEDLKEVGTRANGSIALLQKVGLFPLSKSVNFDLKKNIAPRLNSDRIKMLSKGEVYLINMPHYTPDMIAPIVKAAFPKSTKSNNIFMSRYIGRNDDIEWYGTIIRADSRAEHPSWFYEGHKSEPVYDKQRVTDLWNKAMAEFELLTDDQKDQLVRDFGCEPSPRISDGAMVLAKSSIEAIIGRYFAGKDMTNAEQILASDISTHANEVSNNEVNSVLEWIEKNGWYFTGFQWVTRKRLDGLDRSQMYGLYQNRNNKKTNEQQGN